MNSEDEIVLDERKLRESLANLLNEIKLPAVIKKYALREMLNQLDIIEQKEFEQALEAKKKNEAKEKKKNG